MKKILKDYFTFSRKERLAVVILLSLIAFFLAAPFFYSPPQDPPAENKALADFLSSDEKGKQADSAPVAAHPEPGVEAGLQGASFPFDPNTASAADWHKLGLNDKTIQTILHYRDKGGRFRQPEDLRKIWGIRKADAERLVRYAVIPAKAVQPWKHGDSSVRIVADTQHFYPGRHEPVDQTAVKAPQILDINTAAAGQWESLPGIGKGLAARIINYRDKKGGFMAIEEVKSTYGISDSVFEKIRPFLRLDPANLPGIDLNKVTAWELQRRLYLPAELARGIVQYRQKSGGYTSVEELKKLAFLPDSVYRRIAPRLQKN